MKAFIVLTVVTLCQAALGQTYKDACSKLPITFAVTDKSRTFVRQGSGEFGAPRAEGTHKGNDIIPNASSSDPTVTAVSAFAGGTIAYARENGGPTEGFGNVVVIDHGNGCYSLYAHLSNKPLTPETAGGNLDVALEQKVKGGERIGYFVDIKADMGTTGNAVKTHPAARQQVHFQLFEAPAGRRSTGALSTLLKPDAVIIDPWPLLSKLGYTKLKVD